MSCGTCHDPHEVTANDWKDPYTIPALKKQCQDCHKTQGEFFANNEIHGGNRCTSCHMPVMGSCENFGSIQFPDYGGFDTQRPAAAASVNEAAAFDGRYRQVSPAVARPGARHRSRN